MFFLLLNVCHSCYTMNISLGDLQVYKMSKLILTVNLKCVRTPMLWDRAWVLANKLI